MGTVRIYSTATNSTQYCEYDNKDDPKKLKRKVRFVTILGGTGVARKRGLVTPLGVCTIVTEEQLAFLEQNGSFKRHKQAGFITVVKSSAPDPAKVAENMAQRDGSSPRMPHDYADAKKPKMAKKADNGLSITAPAYVKPSSSGFAEIRQPD